MAEHHDDELLDALAAVVEFLEHSWARVDLALERAQVLREERSGGATYAEILTSAEGPLVIEVLSELFDGVSDCGSRLRRAEARALYAEGLSMDKVSRLLRVSRQRVSALIRGPVTDAEPPVGRDRRRALGLALTDPEFRMIADCLPYIAWVAGPDGATQYLNRQGAAYTGLPADTHDDRDWAALVHPKDREAARRGWEVAVKTETPYDLDYRIRRADGAFRWHRFRSLPTRGADGKVAKWVGTAIDIEDQRQLTDHLRLAEREASDALALLEAFEASAPIGFAIVDDHFRVVRMNQRLADVNGAPIEDHIGRTVSDLVPTLWPELEQALLRVRTKREPVINLEVSGISREEPERTHRWLVSYYPLGLATDDLRIGVVVVDVTPATTRGA